MVVSNAWAGPGERRGGGDGPGEGETEKGRQTGSTAVPGKPSVGGAAMDNLFLLHLRNNFCRGRRNPEQDTECWDSWQRAPLEQVVGELNCNDSFAAIPLALAGTRCLQLLDHTDLACPWNTKPRGVLASWQELL